jgi:hypothetical protein
MQRRMMLTIKRQAEQRAGTGRPDGVRVAR